MNPQDVKKAITVISEIYTRYSNMVADSEGKNFLRKKAFNLIIEYCQKMQYKADGLPSTSTVEEELTEEHWMLYIDKLTLVHDDVAQLHWHWAISFWPDEYQSFEVFIDMIKERIGGSFYDVTLD
ncbi:MAG: hypothetical protein ACO3AY_08570 [Chitinophagaceae bacterium]